MAGPTSQYDRLVEDNANKFKNNVALVVSTANRDRYACMDRQEREEIPDLEYYEPIDRAMIIDMFYVWPHLLFFFMEFEVRPCTYTELTFHFSEEISLPLPDIAFYLINRINPQGWYPDSVANFLQIIKLADYMDDSTIITDILDYHYDDSHYVYHYLLNALNYLGRDDEFIDDILNFIKTRETFDIAEAKTILFNMVPPGEDFTIPDLINTAHLLGLREDNWHDYYRNSRDDDLTPN